VLNHLFVLWIYPSERHFYPARLPLLLGISFIYYSKRLSLLDSTLLA
jgi:hypothetical protein